MTPIKIEDCVGRHVYRIRSRNLRVGVFVPEDGGFIGIRVKFGEKYLFEEYHHDKGGTVSPLEDLGPLPDEIENRETLGSICHNCRVATKYDESKPQVVYGTPMPGTWVHLGPTDCADLQPMSAGNVALFRYLKETEERIGYT